MERTSRPTRVNTTATARLRADATAAAATPIATSLSGSGFDSRPTATHAMLTAATRINAPSVPAEKYSAFSCP
jgi:hypothetical protein